MKKIITFIVISYSLIGTIHANQVVLDTVISIKDIITYNIFDTLEVVAYTNPQIKNSYIFMNKKAVDTNGLQTRTIPIYYEGEIFFNADRIERELEIKEYNLLRKKISNNGELIGYDFKFYNDNGYKQFYVKEKPFTKINTVVPSSGEKHQFIDLWNIIKKEDIEGVKYPVEEIIDIFFLTSKKALICLCSFDEVGSCINKRYLLCFDNDVQDISVKLDVKFDKSVFQSSFSSVDFVNISGNLFRENMLLRATIPSDNIIRNRLFDDNLNYISDVLVLNQPVVMGVNFQKGEVQNHFLRSFLNNGEEVIIPYKFIPELDLAMYKAYNNSNLTKEDLKSFGEYELGILRNLIFAKYNYDFNSEFYQAYFNLYDFYNTPEMRKTRTKDVNGKLTDTDKANLELIKSME